MTFVRSCREPLKQELINTGGSRAVCAKALQEELSPERGTFCSVWGVGEGGECPVCPGRSWLPSATGTPFPSESPSREAKVVPIIPADVSLGPAGPAEAQACFLRQLLSGSSKSSGPNRPSCSQRRALQWFSSCDPRPAASASPRPC